MAAWTATNNDTQQQLSLPQGICNFRDLTRDQAPVCPCRRFYLDASRLDSGRGAIASTWCFCGHHACFHDHNASHGGSQSSQAGQIGRLLDSQADQPISISELASQRLVSQEQEQHISTKPATAVGLGLAGPHSQPGLFEALNAYNRLRPGPESDRSSALPSTIVPSAPPSIVDASAQQFMRHALNITRRRAAPGQEEEQATDIASVTEVNTPSIHGTPMQKHGSPIARLQHVSSARARSIPSTEQRQGQAVNAISPRIYSPGRIPVQPPQPEDHPPDTTRQVYDPSIHELRNIVKTCTKRLDLLESLSYTHVSLEEVEDKFEQVNGRLVSLEDFRSDVEARLPSTGDHGHARRRRPLPAEVTASFSQDHDEHEDSGSDTSAVSATAAVYAEYNNRILSMGNRIDMLEKAVPSPTHPWSVEVILLPWGRHLPGVWDSSPDNDGSNKHSQREEWTADTSKAHDVFGDRIAASAGWTTGSIQAWAERAQDWLSAKACGPNGTIFWRLLSRGLVKHSTMDSPSATHIMQTIKVAFQHVVPSEASAPSYKTPKLEFDALRESLVPLRKTRKISRLSFLAPSEMISSALWTAQFLESSVMMKGKGGHRRLYVTFPDAYLQAGEGWTWSDIRALPVANIIASSISPASDRRSIDERIESAWAEHVTLDAPPVAAGSFASHISGQSLWSTKSQTSRASFHPQQDRRQRERTPQAIVSPVSEARTFRALRRRTVSIPPEDDNPTTSTPRSKRRVASLETTALDVKKRKTSSSSQYPRAGPGLTPRMSREPPSPYDSAHPFDNRSDNTSGRKVVLTPLAYATPHSHTINALAALQTIEREGFSDAETEVIGRSSQAMTNTNTEWRGIGDEQFFPPSQLEHASEKRATVIIRGSDGDESELEE